MGSLKARIRKAERDVQAETMVLCCPECGEEMRVGLDSDLQYIAYLWTLETGAKSHQPTPPDVLVIANHPHDAEGLIGKATGEPWLARLESAGGRDVD